MDLQGRDVRHWCRRKLRHQVRSTAHGSRVAELEASEAQLALVLEQQDRTLHHYRAALETLYEAANTKDRVSLEDLEAAHSALNP